MNFYPRLAELNRELLNLVKPPLLQCVVKLGNLTQVKDNSNNTPAMTYDGDSHHSHQLDKNA